MGVVNYGLRSVLLAMLALTGPSLAMEAESKTMTGMQTEMQMETQMKLGTEAWLTNHKAFERVGSKMHIDAVMSHVSVSDAVKIFSNRSDTSALFKDNLMLIQSGSRTHGKPTASREPYKAIANVVIMLNNMSADSQKKLDATNVECSEYTGIAEGRMGILQGEISDANADFSEASAALSAAKEQEEKANAALEKGKVDLMQIQQTCAMQIKILTEQIRIVQNDADVMDRVVGLSGDCAATPVSLVQCDRGDDSDMGDSFLFLGQTTHRHLGDELQHPFSKRLLSHELGSVYDNEESEEMPIRENHAVALVETNAMRRKTAAKSKQSPVNTFSEVLDPNSMPFDRLTTQCQKAQTLYEGIYFTDGDAGSALSMCAGKCFNMPKDPLGAGSCVGFDFYLVNHNNGTFFCRPMKRCEGEIGNCTMKYQASLNTSESLKDGKNNSCGYMLEKVDPAAAKRKAQAKCTLKNSPNCQKMKDKFLQILAGLQSKVETMSKQLERLKDHCKEQEESTEELITNADTLLTESGTMIDTANKQMSDAKGRSELSNKNYQELQVEYIEKSTWCRKEIDKYAGEICALGKIRGELFKMDGINVTVQDCEVSMWQPMACKNTMTGEEVDCGGDESASQMFHRSIATPAIGGKPCPALTMAVSCGQKQCPINCKHGFYSKPSACTAKCNGGTTYQSMKVIVKPQYGGTVCPPKTVKEACNSQNCDANCKLKKWSRWSKCTRGCGGGLKLRRKMIKVPARGTGLCPKTLSKDRWQAQVCNSKQCPAPVGTFYSCAAKMDVVFMVDGSGSLGGRGWKASVIATKALIGSFNNAKADVRMAVQMFSGPRTFVSYKKCINDPKFVKRFGDADNEKDCNIRWVNEFTDGPKPPMSNVGYAQTAFSNFAPMDNVYKNWPRATTMTSLALKSVMTQLGNSRSDADTVVLMLTDGRPMYPKATEENSKALRKKVSRFMVIPVTRYAPVALIKKMVSHPPHANMIMIKEFWQLAQPKFINSIIKSLCPYPS